MSREGIVHNAIVIRDKDTLLKKCRVCRADLAQAEVIRAWESDGKINTIFACPECGRFNIFWRKKQYGRRS